MKKMLIGLSMVFMGCWLFLPEAASAASNYDFVEIDMATGEEKLVEFSEKYYEGMPDVLEAFNPSKKREAGIIGEDDRVEVSDTTQFPYSPVSHIWATNKDGKGAISSAAFIDENTLIACAHGVYGFKEKIEVTPGKAVGTVPFGTAEVVKMYVPKQYIDTGNLEYDIAILKVDKTLGNTTGWLGLNYLDNKDDVYTITGYPGTFNGNMATSSDTIIEGEIPNVTSWMKDKIHFTIDVTAGNSGSPVYDSQNRINGILSGATWNSNTGESMYNFAARISKEKFAMINHFVQSDPYIPVESARAVPEKVTIQRRTRYTPTVEITPENATNKRIKWHHPGGLIFDIDKNGAFYSMGVGTWVITGETEDGGKPVEIEVTVVYEKISVEGITVTPEELSLTAGDTHTLKATVLPEDAHNKHVRWESSDPSIATVSAEGEVTAKTPGTAEITVTTLEGNKQAVSKVTVNEAPVSVTGITVDPTSKTLALGEKQQLTATVLPENASNKNVVWSSSNEAIAKVSETGEVTTIGIGTATITATTEDGNKQTDSTITVTKPVAVSTVRLKIPSATMLVGSSQQLVLTFTPANATNKNVTWSSSDEAVATISATGEVTAKKSGKTTITVLTEDGNKKATGVITVKEEKPVISVKLTIPNRTMLVGSTQQLTAAITPANASNQNISWSSSNEAVATVSETGEVTAKKSGTTTITVLTEDGNKKATGVITVKEEKPVVSVKLTIPNKTMLVGSTQQLTAAITPTEASNQKVTWSSSNEAVATISETGEVTAKKSGTTTITVITDDGGKKATGVITVKEEKPVVSVKLTIPNKTMIIGEKQSLTPVFTPVDASNQKVAWSSSNEAVATISETGEVTAKTAGRTTITVVTDDGAKKATGVITVKAPAISSVKIVNKKDPYISYLNKTQIIKAECLPAEATPGTLVFESADPKVAQINAKGEIIGKGFGETTIKVYLKGKPEIYDTMRVVTDDHGDSIETASEVKLAELMHGTYDVKFMFNEWGGSTGGDYDYFRFVAPEDGTYVLHGSAARAYGKPQDYFQMRVRVDGENFIGRGFDDFETYELKKGQGITWMVNGLYVTAPRDPEHVIIDTLLGTKYTFFIDKKENIKYGKVEMTNALGMDSSQLSQTLKVGDQIQFNAQVIDTNILDPFYKNIAWESSNKDVAEIDENGLVTIKGKGYVNIRAKNAYGGFNNRSDVKHDFSFSVNK